VTNEPTTTRRKLGLAGGIGLAVLVFPLLVPLGAGIGGYFDHNRSDRVQAEGARRRATVVKIDGERDYRGLRPTGTFTYTYDVTFEWPVSGATRSRLHHPDEHRVVYQPGDPVDIVVDTTHPSYAEEQGSPFVARWWADAALLVIFIYPVFGTILFLVVRQRRRQSKADAQGIALARELSFSWAPNDEAGLLALPVEFLHRGAGREINSEMFGTRGGVRIAVFDFWYYTKNPRITTTSRGGVRRHSERRGPHLTCGLLGSATQRPFLRIECRLGSREVTETAALSGSELAAAFNARFEVVGDDSFAQVVRNDSLMAWLLSIGTIELVEINGPWVLVAREQVEPSQWGEIVGWLDQFRDHLPAAVANL
jgi:hypothetical protein